MEEKKVKKSNGRSTKSKAMTIMLGVTFFCVLSLLLLAILDKGVIFGERIIKRQSTNNSSALNYYHIVDGEDFVLYSADNEVYEKLITFDYPQFDIDGLDSINNSIKELYENHYKELKVVENVEDHGYYLVKDNKKYVNDNELFLLKYKITDTDRYLSIYIEDHRYENASGITNGYGYVYDKLNKKIMTKDEILKLFNSSEKEFIEYYNKYAGCKADGNKDNITSIDEIGIYVIGEKIYFDNSTCCCMDISEYDEYEAELGSKCNL